MIKNTNKGFTIIELIVVIAVIGILVLLAMPKFLGYTKDAKLAQIKNDVRAVEESIEIKRINNEFTPNFSFFSKDIMEELKNEGSLYNKKGVVNKNHQLEDGFMTIEPNNVEVNSKLEGTFILAEGGQVYYYEDNIEFTNLNDDHFEFVSAEESGFPSELAYEVADGRHKGKIGWFSYIGKGIENVEIPDVIHGNPMTSYSMMFYNIEDDSIKNIASRNKNITNTSRMFGMYQSSSLNFSHFESRNVVNMEAMFFGSKVEEIKGLNTSNVRDMSLMFGAHQGTSLDLSGFDTRNVTNMKSMFQESAIKELNISNLNTQNVTNMSLMFSGLQVEKLDLKSFDTSKVEDMNTMFGNSKIAKLDLSSFDTRNVADMHGMFIRSKAKEIIFGERFTTENVVTMSQMFDLAEVESLDLKSFTTENVKSMYAMFSGTKLKELDLSTFNIENVTSLEGIFRKSAIEKVKARCKDIDKFKRNLQGVVKDITFEC